MPNGPVHLFEVRLSQNTGQNHPLLTFTVVCIDIFMVLGIVKIYKSFTVVFTGAKTLIVIKP